MCKLKSEAVGGRYRCSGHTRAALDSCLTEFSAAVQSKDAAAIKKEGSALFTKLADYAKTNEGLYAFDAARRKTRPTPWTRQGSGLDDRTVRVLSNFARIAQTSALQSLHAKRVGKYEQKLNERTMKAAQQVDSLRSSASTEEVKAAHKSFLEADRARREVLPFLETVGSNIHKFRVINRPVEDVKRLSGYDKLSPASKAVVQEYMEDVQKGYVGMLTKVTDKDREYLRMHKEGHDRLSSDDGEKRQIQRAAQKAEEAKKALSLVLKGAMGIAGSGNLQADLRF